MTLPNGSHRTLRNSLVEVVAKASEAGVRHYLAARWRIEPRDLLTDFLASASRDAFFWQEPSRKFALLGLGRAEIVTGLGRDRFAQASARASEVFDRMQTVGLDAQARATDAVGPLLVGGFSFYEGEIDPASEWHGLGPGRLLLPAFSIACRGAAAWATRCCVVEPGDDVEQILDRFAVESAVELTVEPRGADADRESLRPDLVESLAAAARGPEIRVQADRPHGRYAAQVEAALEAIEAGKVEKVVVARSLSVAADADFDLQGFLDALRLLYPACVTVAVREGGHLFVSATPERLVALDGDAVSTAAVAGSAPRGRSPEEEAHFSAALRASGKERQEHDVVKRAIRAALRDVCGVLEGATDPVLLKLEGIQHLESPLFGRLEDTARGHTKLLDLVGRLHPTPAVGGAPREAALDWLERFEALDRGWYAGPIGYVDAAGAGEFRVALRSALLRGRVARLFAGAGIVAGSNPQRELAETRLKLRALLAPLTEI